LLEQVGGAIKTS